MGGIDAVLEQARQFADEGDLRFAATLLGHAVAAGRGDSSASHASAKAMLADVFEKLGVGAENATWRNNYLSQSLDLRRGSPTTAKRDTRATFFAQGLSVAQWFGGMSISIDG
jgi:alkyl sulfatase BDS1-like metallo-beta-lactamase superfamily hydrolase